MRKQAGIYVEVQIRSSLDDVWRLTQDPALHQRWDLRFTRIEYLPRKDGVQHFLYQTRIGFGMCIHGTGSSVGQRTTADGGTTSSLRFSSADGKSLIDDGSGYWRYVPTHDGLRFLTWYDYTVRFGAIGRAIDRAVFRPLMGWATAWSFDCLRLWAEGKQLPEASIALSLAHATARVSIAVIWLWHGIVPKLIFAHSDEQRMLRDAGLPVSLIPWIGGAEVLFGITMLAGWRSRWLFPVNIAVMLLATMGVALKSPAYLQAAFNPVTLDLSVVALAVIGWFTSKCLPTARNCLRTAPENS